MTKEEKKIYNKKYREKHRDELNRKSREWNAANAEHLKAYRTSGEGKEKRRKREKEYYDKNIDAIRKRKREWMKKYYQTHKEERKQYSVANRDKAAKRQRDKRKTDPNFRMRDNLRRRINEMFKNIKTNKPANTEKILGAPFAIVKKHIENQFREGMSWENHSFRGWHIDHRIPLISAKNKEELIGLCHYTNLQPLWAIDNMQKGKKYGG